VLRNIKFVMKGDVNLPTNQRAKY